MARPQPWLNPAVWTSGGVPASAVALRAVQGELRPNPISEALNRLGLTALVFLIGALGCTPLQLIFKWGWPARVRRTVGLLGFS